MSFQSELFRGEVVIDSTNFQRHTRYDRNGVSQTGYVHRDRDKLPTGTVGSRRMPRELIIPRDEWHERIEEQQRTKTRPTDFASRTGIEWLNQSPSWYCWCYCVVQAAMLRLAIQGEPYRGRLVPESVAGPIMNYRKQGGMPHQAVEFAKREGIADARAWPWQSHRQANDRRYYAGSRDNAAKIKIGETWDLETLDELASCLLRQIPVPGAYLFMGHAMAAADLLSLGRGTRDSDFGVRNIDSYARGGRFNSQVLKGRQAIGDEMIAICTVTPQAD